MKRQLWRTQRRHPKVRLSSGSAACPLFGELYPRCWRSNIHIDVVHLCESVWICMTMSMLLIFIGDCPMQMWYVNPMLPIFLTWSRHFLETSWALWISMTMMNSVAYLTHLSPSPSVKTATQTFHDRCILMSPCLWVGLKPSPVMVGWAFRASHIQKWSVCMTWFCFMMVPVLWCYQCDLRFMNYDTEIW